MKKTALFVPSILLFSSMALAAASSVDLSTLKTYAKRSAASCPDATVVLQPIQSAGPSNFLTYDMTVKSADDSCTSHKYMLYSPTTQQIVIGSIFQLPSDPRPVKQRVEENASQALKSDVTATVAPFPLPDGLKSVQISKGTEYGPFNYQGYVDAAERFLIVGTRGNLRTDPHKTFRDALHVDQLAVRRGNPNAKVEIIEFSDLECPSCAHAHKLLEPLISKNLSKLKILRMDFPLFEHHEWAMAAALGARAIARVAPNKYWAFVDFVFNNQETIGKSAFDKVLQNFCEDHDIAWAKVLSLYRSPTERQALLNSVSDMFDNGLNATPTFVINGQIVAYGKEGSNIESSIKAALAGK